MAGGIKVGYAVGIYFSCWKLKRSQFDCIARHCKCLMRNKYKCTVCVCGGGGGGGKVK